MNDAIRRALRTFMQALVGTVVTSGVVSSIGTTGVVDWSVLQKAGISALVAGIVAVISYLQNALEDAGAVSPILKGPSD